MANRCPKCHTDNPLSPKKLLTSVLVILIAVITALLQWRIQLDGAPAPIPTDKPSLAVLYFENNSGNAALDHWQSGLCEMLITDLSQSRYLHVLSRKQIYSLLEQFDLLDRRKYNNEDLRKVATREEVTHILLGNYMTVGNTFIINLMLLDAETGAMISSIKEEGMGEESLTDSVDKITRDVKSALNFTRQQIDTDVDKDVGMITTRSPEAYKYYVEGIKYDVKGEYPKVIEYMAKAVVVDPEFAAAYQAMSRAYGNQNDKGEEKANLDKALQYSERLSDREKYRIQGAYYFELPQYKKKSEEALLNLVKLYPDDTSGHNSLGIMYRGMRLSDKAIHHFERAVEAGTKDVVLYANLARAYGRAGLHEKEREVLESYIRNVSDNPRIHQYLAEWYFYQGQNEQALAEFEKAEMMDPDDLSTDYLREQGILYLHTGDLIKAEKKFIQISKGESHYAQNLGERCLSYLRLRQGKFTEFDKHIQASVAQGEHLGYKMWVFYSLYHSSQVDLRRGNPARAMQSLNKCWDIAIEEHERGLQPTLLSARGLIYLALKNMQKARDMADEIKTWFGESLNQSMDGWGFYLLQGHIELEKNQYSQAIVHFQEGLSLLSADNQIRILFIDSLGLAYFRSGDLARAQKEYTHLTQLNFVILDGGDILVRAYYMLGKIAEAQGNKAAAIENFEKFLTMWKDADPGLPEVDDARMRLTALQ